ncbi:hypothetical protein MNBD_GAMMA25-778 [hydrothermal vent metagenome]|uniref:Uncharacterized protein n=1 Tax=hydrothermal vent metagenome TaxID=652676 RepID=A0A3B1B6P8_9ZZZZ
MKVKKQIKLEQAETGQSLSDDVCDAQGNCLMAAGVELNMAMLKRLQDRGVEILVVWEEQTLSETELAEQQVAIKARLAHRFRQMQDKPVMIRLHDVLLSYQMECFAEQTTLIASEDNAGDSK